MNRTLVLVGLIFCISAINCENIQDIKVENICPDDVFTYENLNGNNTVNTIVRSQFDIYFVPLFWNVINYRPSYFFEFFENKDHANRMIEIVESFDNKIKEIFSEDYINNPQKFDNIENDLQLIEKLHAEIDYLRLNHINSTDENIRESIMIGRFANNGHSLIKQFNSLRKNKYEATAYYIGRFIKLMNEVKDTLINKNNLKFVLEENSIYDLFRSYEIFQKNKFEFFENKYDYLSSTGVMRLDVILPYNNLDYKKEEIKDCVKLDQLPKFYHKQRNL